MTEETRTTESPVTDEENPAQAVGDAGVKGALSRFRVTAYIVGVGLLALCFGLVMNVFFDQDQYSAVIGPVHGFLYIVYLLAIVDLALKARWSLKGTILVMLSGVVPVGSFFAERAVTHRVQKGNAL
jgi:integral membrane protein